MASDFVCIVKAADGVGGNLQDCVVVELLCNYEKWQGCLGKYQYYLENEIFRW